MSPARRRLDRVLVDRGLAVSRPQAAELVARGLVLVGGAVADKPARLVAPSDPVEVQAGPPPFVGRGGEKLQAALLGFGLDVAGRRVLDAGASTGGFTDCLLQAGARRVYAVDVGHGQLHPRLRHDPRVVVLEHTDVRDLSVAQLDRAPAEAAVVDLSFISLATVVASVLERLVAPGGAVVLLVKPQFEAGRAAVSRGRGVVRDPATHRAALGRVAAAVADGGGVVEGALASPVRGRSGNLEFLLLVRRPLGAGSTAASTPVQLLDDVVAGAHATRQDDRSWR